MNLTIIISVISASYFAGSIPSSYLAGKWLKSIDIRNFGSGNPGATNTLRVLGKKAGFAVLLFDFLKGFIPLIIASRYFNPFQDNESIIMIICGLSVITGHIFPVWLKFKGGKGVASSAGVFTALYPPIFPVSIFIFSFSVLIFKKISAASIITALSVPLTYKVLNIILKSEPDKYITVFTLIIPLIIIIRHRSNIIRILTGREPDMNDNRKEL